MVQTAPKKSKRDNVNEYVLASSFRDPSGFLFTVDDTLYRQVNQSYQADYDRLMSCRLYDELVSDGMLIPHVEVDNSLSADPENLYKVIAPERVPFISYPYEWSFSQLKDAALLTLAIQKKALAKQMTLKDASAYNIQFISSKSENINANVNGLRPVLIDTLSFENHDISTPWIAYKQFCQHFLAPLLLMSKTDIRLNQLLKTNIDGIPIDIASKLLPWKTKLDFDILTHIHWHAKTQAQYADIAADSDSDVDRQKNIERAEQIKQSTISKSAELGYIDSLETLVKKLTWGPAGTEWGDYYSATNYSSDSFKEKANLVSQYIDAINNESTVRSLWDLGGNTGIFSRIASEKGIHTLSFDIDPAAVEKNYRQARYEQGNNILPLLLDLTNPSGGIGWGNAERESLAERGPADVIMALALVHHIAISNNVPLDWIADYFSKLGDYLIIEFIPKSDSQVKRLLATREDVFPDYTEEGFEKAFSRFYDIQSKTAIAGSQRTLFKMKNRN